MQSTRLPTDVVLVMVFPLPAAIILGAVLLIGCAGSGPPSPDLSPDSAIIVVPGYYGSRLSQASDHELVWISLGEALTGTRSLVLPHEGLGIQDGLVLRPDGILNGVTVIPYLYTVDAYGPLLNRLRNEFAQRTLIVPLAYDWRLDLAETVRALSETVDLLHQRGISRIVVLAHSMGGLVTAYYLRYGMQDPDSAVESWSGSTKLSGAILTGVPYHGSMATFRNMQYGRTVGLNDTLLSSEAVASFPASYYVLPSPQHDLLVSSSLQPFVGRLYQPDAWRDNEWGLFRNSEALSDTTRDNRMLFTARWLTRARQFFERLHAPSGTRPNPAVPLLSVKGRGTPTLAKGLWIQGQEGPSPNVLFDHAHLQQRTTLDRAVLLEDGDGTVTMTSGSLPEGYRSALRSRELQLEMEHGDLVSDSNALDQMASFIESVLNTGN